MTAVAALMVLQRPAHAGPEGGTVVAGQAGISQAGSVTNINQSTNKAIINWQGFSVGAHETVNFNQPGTSSVTLNRVIGNESSVISGALNANGQVFVVNSAGVLFGKGAQVNVGGLVASTRDISNTDFMAGNYVFSGSSTAAVVNQGRLRARDGGYVALLGRTVSNEGMISARLGTVAMASGDRITLNFTGDSLVDVTVDKGTLNALVENKRAIRADGGQVIMTAKSADALLSAQVNNSGVIQARTMAALTGGTGRRGTVQIGKIKLIADGGIVKVSGKLDASAPNGGNGGFIETSGSKVQIADSAVFTTLASQGKTGTWLIDPTDFNIVAGSGALTGSGIGALTLANNLATSNVVITTIAGGTEKGDINVNADVSWLANTILTLNAANNININAKISAGGANAGLVLNYGGYNGTTVTTPLAGTGYTINMANGASVSLAASGPSTLNGAGLTINGNAYTLIHSMAQLAAISGSGGLYALGSSIDASASIASPYTDAVVNSLDGTLAGLGHTITNLTIAEPVHLDFNSVPTGLIGTAQSGSVIRDIGLVGANVKAYGQVGALVGLNAGGSISQAYVTGSVMGATNVGGLVGRNAGGVIANSYSDAVVSGYSVYDDSGFTYIGGLVGWNFGFIGSPSLIIGSHATGAVSAIKTNKSVNISNIGGLVGGSTNSTVSGSYATGNVNVGDIATSVGGLVGLSGGATARIENSFATGNVTGGKIGVGGLVGNNLSGATIVNSYATGNVIAGGDLEGRYFGGLVGVNNGGSISGSSASGNVTVVAGEAGGLVGGNLGSTASITNSSASGNVTGGAGSYVGGLVGYNSGGTISGSTATGDVSGETAGGLAGANDGGIIANSLATGSVFGSARSEGLVGGNFGTIINSVYRDVKAIARADAAARAQAAARAEIARTGSTIATASAEAAATPPDARLSAGGTRAASTSRSEELGENTKAIAEAIKKAEVAAERARRQAAAAANRAERNGSAGRGPGFGATIRSIDIDGQHFDLRGGNSGRNAPGATR